MAGLSAVEDIREILRREIVETMRADDMLPNERELAERFNVSRNTVRETMIHLEAFGLIEKTKRGARVRKRDLDPIFNLIAQQLDNSPKTLVDVLNFRRIVETGAAPLVASSTAEDVAAAMERANERMGQALTASDAAVHDHDFHFHLVEGAGNAVLTRMYRVLSTSLKFYLEVGKSRNHDTAAAYAQHKDIIACLRAHDTVALVAALNRHFDHSGAVLATYQSSAPDQSKS